MTAMPGTTAPGVFTEADLEQAERDAAAGERRVLALIAGLLVLAGPRRTRPLAGFLYGVALSRVHGVARDRLGDEIGSTIGRLFDERTSVGARTDALARRVQRLERRLSIHEPPQPDPAMDSGAQG